jgi:hypothetical protein
MFVRLGRNSLAWLPGALVTPDTAHLGRAAGLAAPAAQPVSAQPRVAQPLSAQPLSAQLAGVRTRRWRQQTMTLAAQTCCSMSAQPGS